jgi:hypothetical protein
MTNPSFYIHSLALSFNKAFIRDMQAARNLSGRHPAHRLLYYGDTAILIIYGALFNPLEPVIAQIVPIIQRLQAIGILYQNLQFTDMKIHELEVKFIFPYFQPFICHSSGFRKVENLFLSRDYRKIYRSNAEVKGMQKSFVCVSLQNYGMSSNLILNIAGRKRQYLSMLLLNLCVPAMLPYLTTLLSCFLSQAVTPEDFTIHPNFLPYLDTDFTKIFTDAGWFSENPFVKKRVRNFNDRGLLCLENSLQ